MGRLDTSPTGSSGGPPIPVRRLANAAVPPDGRHSTGSWTTCATTAQDLGFGASGRAGEAYGEGEAQAGGLPVERLTVWAGRGG